MGLQAAFEYLVDKKEVVLKRNCVGNLRLTKIYSTLAENSFDGIFNKGHSDAASISKVNRTSYEVQH